VAGTVDAIHIAPKHGRLPEPVASVEVTADGVHGDRHYGRRNITLIEAEALEGMLSDTGIDLSAAESRRQVLTRGIRLNELAGKRFTVGEVECVGEVWCEPCVHLQRLTRPGVLQGLVHRGGLRADIVRGGRIAVGDPVDRRDA
jgi:MOSC domain-containing protein YiiM